MVLHPPLFADCGPRIRVGVRTFANFGLIALDVAPITIFDGVQIGPNVQLLTPIHPQSAAPREWFASSRRMPSVECDAGFRECRLDAVRNLALAGLVTLARCLDSRSQRFERGLEVDPATDDVIARRDLGGGDCLGAVRAVIVRSSSHSDLATQRSHGKGLADSRRGGLAGLVR